MPTPSKCVADFCLIPVRISTMESWSSILVKKVQIADTGDLNEIDRNANAVGVESDCRCTKAVEAERIGVQYAFGRHDCW